MSLHGRWNFKIGDNPNWAKPNFDDSNWDRINVPGRWEEQGYQGYDGYAWYRKKVEIPASFSDRTLYLELGYIDDVDEVFFNGTKIGQTGSFPPNYLTAYNAYRKYEIPLELVNYGKSNTISVRVYDSQLEGGIVQKHVRIGVSDIAITPDINLSGLWNFNTGKEINRSKQVEILVPGQWENQGFNNYDGYAVYQRKFNLPPDMVNKRMIFLAGRIDDFDQLYINGKFIGQTGDFEKPNTFDKHAEFRNYFIPPGILKTGENEVIIKIYDGRGEGGILEGNVGLITQDKFIKLWKMRRK
jgi:beta-galactosidase/beta-glucuronidase